MRLEDRDAIRQNFLGEEDGHIYFFYYPKTVATHNEQEVEHISFILHPFDSKLFRLISLNGVSLPQTANHFNMVNGIVQKVDDKQSVIKHELEEQYQMVLGVPQLKRASARPCGEGVYSIICPQNNSNAYLVYALEFPNIHGKIKELLHINTEGAFTFGVYNPYLESETEIEASRKQPHYPENLKNVIKKQRIIYDRLPQLLNYENSKLVLFKEEDLDMQTLRKQLHPLAATSKTADIFTDLNLQREKFPVEPLFKGEWK